jgi:hypothetical protein
MRKTTSNTMDLIKNKEEDLIICIIAKNNYSKFLIKFEPNFKINFYCYFFST